MCDPLSAISLAVESIGILIYTGKELKSFAESIKNARKEVEELIRHIGTMKNLFHMMHITLVELQKIAAKDFMIAIDERRCHEILLKLQELVNDIMKNKPDLGFMDKVNWVMRKNSAKSLCQQMKQEEEEISKAVMLASAATTFRTHSKVESIVEGSENISELYTAFAGISIGSEKLLVQFDENPGTSFTIRTWLGQVIQDHLPVDYVELRKKYHNAAFLGNWDLVFQLLDEAKMKYNECWVNATRLKPINQAHQMSMWTVLHQAAYHRAPIDVIKKLITLGASQTLRSRWSQYSYLDMTALDLAREFQASELYELLTPAVCYTIPHATLDKLESHFHHLITDSLGDRVKEEKLYLPVLEPLTEFESQPVWFPVAYGENYEGFAYQLDGRALIVKYIRIGKDRKDVTYRITEANGPVEIEEALVT